MRPLAAIGKRQRVSAVDAFELDGKNHYPLQRISLIAAFFCCSISRMEITFDPEKNARNIVERGMSFERVAELDWDTAVLVEDTRRNYGELRPRVLGRLDGRLHAAVVRPRGEHLRVISFRRASRREVRLYGKKDR
jgi:uncharacterized DUF497 family protein